MARVTTRTQYMATFKTVTKWQLNSLSAHWVCIH